MNFLLRFFHVFALILLLLCLFFGVIAVLSFYKYEYFTEMMSFQQVRPFHVSAALFWIITGALAGILYFARDVFGVDVLKKNTFLLFIISWSTSIVIIFLSYCFGQFGGREYWEFPPVLNILLLISWLFLMAGFFPLLLKSLHTKSVYVWMWATGILFFLFTFIEQNLWNISWFRQSFIREMTIQWKSNGSMVGAWNQLVYGIALYLMVKITGDEKIAQTKKAIFFYVLGVTNLIFNWGHHIYNVPAAGWIRGISYSISMTEWIIVISIIQDFRNKISETKKFQHLYAYRFLIASEFWVFINLLLALLMSVPAVNRYTHGTHVTVAHAMGTTIGINTMILLASICYVFRLELTASRARQKILVAGFWITQLSLLILFISLVIAGLLKGYRMVSLKISNFQEAMDPVLKVLKVFMWSGLALFAALSMVIYILYRSVLVYTDENLLS